MAQNQQNDRPEGEENINLNQDPQRSEMGRRAEEPRAAEATPATQKARSGGRGEVRSETDRRLQDNLTPQQRSEIGRKGGESVSRNREHMAAIGRKGGQTVSQNREHMAAIGREGGRA